MEGVSHYFFEDKTIVSTVLCEQLSFIIGLD